MKAIVLSGSPEEVARAMRLIEGQDSAVEKPKKETKLSEKQEQAMEKLDAALKAAQEKQKVIVVKSSEPKPMLYHRHMKRHKHQMWTKERDAVLVEMYPYKRVERVASALHTTVGAIYARAKKLGVRKEEYDKRKFSLRKPLSDVAKQAISDGQKARWARLKAAQKAAEPVPHEAKTMLRKHALVPKPFDKERIALANHQKGAVVLDTEVPVPHFPALDRTRTEPYLAQTVLQRMIKLQGRLRFSSDAFIFGVADMNEWKLLLNEIFMKANVICKFFEVPNRFKLVNDGRYIALQYGNGEGNVA